MSQKLPTIGFLGAGAIVNALVDGLCLRAADVPYPLIVSDIDPRACQRLQQRYPQRVTAVASTQECVDNSDWVVIAVWPKVGEQLLRSLSFRPRHKVINLMFDKTSEQLREWMNCEVEVLMHMIPGTFLTYCSGPIVQCPYCAEAAEIFGHIGQIVSVEGRYQTAALWAITGLFSPIFALMEHVIDWAVQEEGVPLEAATSYTTAMFAAVCQEACGKDKEGIHQMAFGGTPGGINRQATDMLAQNGAFDQWYEVLKPLMLRTAANARREK